MSHDLRPFSPAQLEPLRALLAEPALAEHFDQFQGAGGLESKLADPRLPPDGIRIAWADGEPAGFGVLWWLPQDSGHWAMLRVGVAERFRRRGIGRALGAALLESVRARAANATGPVEASTSAWHPNPAADALTAAAGGEHERWFWLMARPRGEAPVPVWPAGVTSRTFDGSERAIADWTACYEDSFAEHFRHVRADLDTTRRIVADPAFRAEGLLLAYRDGRCAGFCRCALFASRGEIGVLGTIRAARGIGLGRALLRWGVRWLEANSEAPVTLLVDGANEGAVALYRSERFEVARTRRLWRLPLEASA